MFCPNCGANNSTEQKFCRGCGLNLEKSAESLIEQLPTARSATVLRHEKAIETFGTFALGGLFLAGVLGVITLLRFLIEKLLVSGTINLASLVLIAFIVFAALSLAFVVCNEWIKEKKAKLNAPLKRELTETVTTGKLIEEKSFIPAAVSIAENSTELLLTKNDTRKFE